MPKKSGRFYGRVAIVSFLLLLVISVYFLWLFIGLAGKISLNHFELFSGESLDQELQSAGLLEKNSQVEGGDLYTFFLFSNMRKRSLQKSSELYKKSFPPILGSNLLTNIDQDVTLPSVISNHCNEIYCFQHRVDFSALPSGLWKGLIGTEDYRFLEHKGIDARSLLRALIANLRALKFIQGGSTLSQQLVKNLVLNREKTIHRKIVEMMGALWIESRYTKQEIITAYFNEIEWGVIQGIRCKGVYSASLFYFGKVPRELSPFEVAILISLLKGPDYFHPLKHSERLQERAHSVFRKLYELKLISEAEWGHAWKGNNWKEWEKNLRKNEEELRFYAFWEVFWLKTQNSQSNTAENFESYVFLRQARIFLQDLKKKGYKNLSIKASFLNINPKNSVLSWYSSIERDLVVALEKERHQIGSLVKPFLFRVFLDLGIDPYKQVDTSPIVFNLKTSVWTPKDAVKNVPAMMSVREVFLHSLNRAVLRIATDFGLDEVEKAMLVYFPMMQRPLREYPAQMLGALELTFKELFESFYSLITKDCPWWWNEADRSALFHLSYLKDATVARILKFKDWEFFGKTGTTNNGLDNWFLAFDGERADLIWVGVDGDRSQMNLNLSGAKTSFIIYQNYLTRRGKRLHNLKCPHF